MTWHISTVVVSVVVSVIFPVVIVVDRIGIGEPGSVPVCGNVESEMTNVWPNPC